MKGTPEISASLTSIRDLLIDTPDGGQVRLGDVADVRISPNPNVINLQAISRYVDVAADIDGRSRGAVASDVERRSRRLSSRSRTTRRCSLRRRTYADGSADRRSGSLAAIGVLLLLQAAFGSWGLAAAGLRALCPWLSPAARWARWPTAATLARLADRLRRRCSASPRETPF